MISRISSLGRNVIHLTVSSAPWHIGAHASVPPFSVRGGSMEEPGADRRVTPAVILVAADLSDLGRLMPLALQQAHDSGARLILMHVDVDRILLGTRSRSKISKLLLGSVAEQVLRSVNIPVITVGPEAHLGAAGGNGSDSVVLHATTLRDLEPERSACLPNRLSPTCKTGPSPCSSLRRGNGTERVADGGRFNCNARVASPRRRDHSKRRQMRRSSRTPRRAWQSFHRDPRGSH